MCKFIYFFFSVVFLFNVEISAHGKLRLETTGTDGHPRELATATVMIDRSPSTSRDIDDFFSYVEGRVYAVSQAAPKRKLCLNFNTTLLGLFQRLEEASEEVRSQWKTEFRTHMEKLAQRYAIHKLSFKYTHLGHLTFAAYVIEPFVRYIESLDIEPIMEGRMFIRTHEDLKEK